MIEGRTTMLPSGWRRASVGAAALALAGSLSLGGCSEAPSTVPLAERSGQAGSPTATQPSAMAPTASPTTDPPVYAAAGAGMLTGAALDARRLVYVPNQLANTVQDIDPRTYRVIARQSVPASPEHVVPSWDLRRLWVNSDRGDALTPIDPRTGAFGTPVKVRDPYNLYFTPDGEHALVMASRYRAIDVLDPQTMKQQRSLPVPECAGVNHADFTADLEAFIASCEFNGRLVVVDRNATRVLKVIDLNAIPTPGATPRDMARHMGGARSHLANGASSMPQDARLTPDGRWFMVADMLRNGVWFINARTFTYDHFVRTGLGAHGIYPSRDARRVFVSNRDEGTITVFDATTDQPVAKWRIPGHGTPDMGGVTADGSQLWLSGRYSSEVYVIDTTTGRLLQRIHTDAGPHGLLVWPQPGRFSLGHTGATR